MWLRSPSVRITLRALLVHCPDCHSALLYYDYLLTLDRELRLLWTRNCLKRWGSILFFLNRYCGTIGHIPIFVEIFVQPESALCKYVHAYHQLLAAVMQMIVAGMPLCSSYTPCVY